MISARALVVVVFALGALVFAAPSQLSYNVGDEFVFDLNAYVDSKGQLQDGSRTDGSFSTMNGYVVTQVQDFSNNTYLFVMNMFNVNVNVGQSTSDTVESRKLTGPRDDDSLGYDMYFAQLPTGEITEIWYQDGDSPYFVNVKVGAINAFQTKMVPANQAPVKAIEQDPVGNHYSYFVGAGSDSLVVTKTFTEQDFNSFPDPNLKRHNLHINANTQTTVHPSGHISASSVVQDVVIVNINPSSSAKTQKHGRFEANTNTTGFDMLLSSFGNLSIAESSSQTKNRLLVSYHNIKTNKHNFETIRAANNMISTTMLDWASSVVGFVGEMDALDMEKEVMRMMAVRGQPRKEWAIMKQWIKYFNNAPEETPKLAGYLKQEIVDDWLYVLNEMFVMLASLDNPIARPHAHDLLISYGLQSPNTVVQHNTILTLASANRLRITQPLFQAMVKMVDTNGLKTDMGRLALLALGAAVGRADDAQVIALAKQYFQTLIQKSGDEDQTLIIDAVGNAGPNGISLTKFLTTFGKLMWTDSGLNVKHRVVKALRKFPSVKVVPWLMRVSRDETNVEILRVINKSIKKHLKNLPLKNTNEYLRALEQPRKGFTFAADDFPFNKSYTKDITFGGQNVNAKFDLDLFAGTNFDCNQQYFNYEALAESDAVINFYSESKTAFEAEAVYGKANGVIVGNEIYLQVWDDVIYQNQLPVVDCNVHTYPILQKSTGFDYTYTIWVSVIPVTFEAAVDLSLNLQWGWQICDSDLGAMVELIPDGAIVISGNAEIDLLIIKAGVTLSAQFEAVPTPQGYIQGSECEIGLDVDLTVMPMSAEFLGYYAWDDCKYWIFDCHWGEHNQQVFWSWSHPGSQEVIFNESWKIAQA